MALCAVQSCSEPFLFLELMYTDCLQAGYPSLLTKPEQLLIQVYVTFVWIPIPCYAHYSGVCFLPSHEVRGVSSQDKTGMSWRLKPPWNVQRKRGERYIRILAPRPSKKRDNSSTVKSGAQYSSSVSAEEIA